MSVYIQNLDFNIITRLFLKIRHKIIMLEPHTLFRDKYSIFHLRMHSILVYK